MNYKVYGEDRPETLMLLHGGGLSWWNYRVAAGQLQGDYRVILPILDGHAGSDRPFTSIEDNAREIIGFIDERLGGRVPLIAGLSLGGQVLLEMLARRGDLCRIALVESAMATPSPLTQALTGPAVGCSYGLIQSRAFAKLQFAALHMPGALFEDYYRDSCAIQRADMIAFIKASAGYALKPSVADCGAKVFAFVGSREYGKVLRSARRIRSAIPGSELVIFPGAFHGGLSMSDEYAEVVRRLMRDEPLPSCCIVEKDEPD